MILLERQFWVDAWHIALPVMLALALVLATALPFGAGLTASITPDLPLAAIYYWSVFAPFLMPVWAVLLIGLFNDAVTGLPFGQSAIVWLLVAETMRFQRKFFVDSPFWVGWGGFVLAAAASSLLGWIITSLYYAQAANILLLGGQFFLTIAIYPLVAWPLSRLNRYLLG